MSELGLKIYILYNNKWLGLGSTSTRGVSVSELGQRGITNQPTHQHQGNIDHHYQGNMIVDWKK